MRAGAGVKAGGDKQTGCNHGVEDIDHGASHAEDFIRLKIDFSA
jgi:hypothetical protein